MYHHESPLLNKSTASIIMAQDFFGGCFQTFQFLEDEFGFKRGSQGAWEEEYQLVYYHEKTAVTISRSGPFIDITLYKLDGTDIAQDNRWQSKYSWLQLNWLINLRSRDVAVRKVMESHDTDPFTKADMDRTLELYATALRRYGTKLLQGDFESSPQIERMIESRAQAIEAHFKSRGIERTIIR